MKLLLLLLLSIYSRVYCGEHRNTNTSAETSENNSNIEIVDLGEPDISSLPEDYPTLTDGESDGIDYEAYSRNNVRPGDQFEYRYRENPFRSSYAKRYPSYQPYVMASDQTEAMARPTVHPFMNHIKQHPIYANLYWRKIVYPSVYPGYAAQNSDDNIVVADNSGELQPQESVHSNRRVPNRSVKKYYRNRKRYPYSSVRPMDVRSQMTPLYPIPLQSSPMQSNYVHFKNPKNYYQRKRSPNKRRQRNRYVYANYLQPY